MAKLGERLNNRVKELGLNLTELAEKVGTSRATLFRYKDGDTNSITIEVIEKLAKELRVSPAYLMGWEDFSELDKKEIDLSRLVDNIVTFNGEELTVEEKEKAEKILGLTLK
ncbi:TPA: helix-turn-helix domain-containing protein [Streptococcus suis]